MAFPGENFIADPLVDLRYEIEINALPADIWPWLVQMGYHRAGWYIDTWWDQFSQHYFWPLIVPPEARGSYKPPADTILLEYQSIAVGDIVPDGPPGSAYYEVVALEENRLLLLRATTHFNYMAPRFVYRTRFAPRGSFCWAFILSPISARRSRLTSWWQAEAKPRTVATFLKPLLVAVDGSHQNAILRGVKGRVEERHSQNRDAIQK